MRAFTFPDEALVRTCATSGICARHLTKGNFDRLLTVLISASLLLCESVLWEKNIDLPTAIRILSSIQVAPSSDSVQLFSLVHLYSSGLDLMPHTVAAQIVDPTGQVVAPSEPFRFVYGYKVDANGPGGFILSTQFNFHVNYMGVHWAQLLLDGELVTQVPLMLRRM